MAAAGAEGGAIGGITGGVTGFGVGGDATTGVGATDPLLASSTSCRLPPRALATACSNRLARLCTMPIQLPATCTTARLASIRTNWACCDSNIRVEGSSRLPRICCHNSGRLTSLLEGLAGSGAEDAGCSVAVGVTVSSGVAGGGGAGAGAGTGAGLGAAAVVG